MAAPLQLSERWTLDAIEESLHQIATGDGAPVQLPKDFVGKRRGAMHDAARLQMLVTWARRAESKQIFFHQANVAANVLSELCEYAPGIALLRLADEVVVGESRTRRREALVPATEKMSATDEGAWDRVLKGRTIDFSCVSGSKVQYLRPLFSSRKKTAVKTKGGMYETLRSLSEFVAKQDAGAIPGDFLQACGIFACELLKNTQQHATSDRNNNDYLAHVEGLIISWQEMDAVSYKRDFQGHARLREFWQREEVQIRGGQQTAVRCLQLSFFDTGPGLACRFSGKGLEELTLDQEREILLGALMKNASTKREIGSGNGFPEVLEALQEAGGLLSLRSGRLCVFNAFSQDAFAQPNEADLFRFDNWTTELLAPVEGAVVTLLLPIRR